MSRITITLPNELVSQLMEAVDSDSKTQAVIDAIKYRIREEKKKRIKNLVGKIEFDLTAEELRHGDHRLG